MGRPTTSWLRPRSFSPTEAVKLDYLLRHSQGNWKIVDVCVYGTSSELTIFRSIGDCPDIDPRGSPARFTSPFVMPISAAVDPQQLIQSVQIAEGHGSEFWRCYDVDRSPYSFA
jgi:hypothetical protein